MDPEMQTLQTVLDVFMYASKITDAYSDIDNMNINQNRGVEIPRKEGKKNDRRRIKSFGLYGFKGSNSYHGFDKLFSDFNIEILHPIEQTNLQNYYKKDFNKHIIHCLLCNLDIEQADNNVLSHTISPAHKYNKLFYNFVQNHRKEGNIDYIIFNQWAVCRYCDDVIFPKFSTELLSDHITNGIHLDKKRYCLYRASQYSSNLESKHFAKNVLCENMEKQKIVTTASDAVALNGLNRIFSHCSIEKLNTIDKIDLQYYNAIKFRKGTIHCPICDVDIEGTLATPHTYSLTHQRNKVFYNFVQTRYRFGNIDYIVLGDNWVMCRYCDNVIIPSFSTELRISHLQLDKHLIRKQYCLNRITNVQKFSTETESFPTCSTEFRTNRMQEDEHLGKEQYYFNRIACVQKRDTETEQLNFFTFIFAILICIYMLHLY